MTQRLHKKSPINWTVGICLYSEHLLSMIRSFYERIYTVSICICVKPFALSHSADGCFPKYWNYSPQIYCSDRNV